MIATWFLRFAVITGVAGPGLGLYMAASHDPTRATVHAHMTLIGWVGMFLAGLFHAAHRHADDGSARLHLAVAVAGVATLVPAIAAVHLGADWGPALAGLGSVPTLTAAMLFATVVFRATARRAARFEHGFARREAAE